MRVFRIKHKPTGNYVLRRKHPAAPTMIDAKGSLYFTYPTMAVKNIKTVQLGCDKINVNDGDLQIIELKKL